MITPSAYSSPTPASIRTNHTAGFLARALLEAHPRANTMTPFSMPNLPVQTWSSPNSPVTKPPGGLPVPSSPIAREEATRENLLCTSELDDDTFFQQYANRTPKDRLNKNEPFPLKLYRILHEAKLNHDDDIISFCPGGRSFIIHNIDEFVKRIMPKYFTSQRMTSFQRQLNLYGFRRRLRGDDKGGFFHDSFVKGQRKLCLSIKRKVQNFKIPPHLLTDHSRSSPVATPTTAAVEPKATPRMILSSRPFRLQTRQQSITPEAKATFQSAPSLVGQSSLLLEQNPHLMDHTPRMMEQTPRLVDQTPRLTTSLSLRAPKMTQGLPLLPSLVSGKVGPLASGCLASPLLPSATPELLRLNQRIQLAKERAAVKQQLAMATIQRLVNRIDTP